MSGGASPKTEDGAEAARDREFTWVAGLAGIGLLLALLGADHWSMWKAEVFTWSITQDAYGSAMSAVSEDKHPPVYFTIMWLLARLGDADRLMRLPSAASYAGLVFVMGWLGRRLLGSGWGRALAVVTLLHPVLITASLTARATAMAALLGGLLVVALVRRWDGARFGLLGLFGLSLLGPFVHYSLLGPIFGAGLASLLAVWWGGGWRREGLRSLRTPLALAAGAAAFVPWYLLVTAQQMSGDQPVDRSLAILQYLGWPVGQRVFWLLALPMGFLALLGLTRCLRNRSEAWAQVGVGMAVAGVLYPYGVSSVVEAWWKFYLYAPLLPAFLLLAGLGAQGLWEGESRLARGLLAATGVLVLGGLGHADLALAALPSSPMAPTDREPGLRDVRIEADVLAEVLAGRALGGRRPAEAHGRYRPEVSMPGSTVSSWQVQERRSYEVSLSTTGPAVCHFDVSFTPVLSVWPMEDCVALRQAMAAHPDYGPFLLEEALLSARRGDLEGAESSARRAADRMQASPLGPLVLAIIAWERADPEAVEQALLEGIAQGERWANGFANGTLLSLHGRLEEVQGRLGEQTEWRSCMGSTQPTWLCGTPLAGTRLSKWMGHVQPLQPLGSQGAGGTGGPAGQPTRPRPRRPGGAQPP